MADRGLPRGHRDALALDRRAPGTPRVVVLPTLDDVARAAAERIAAAIEVAVGGRGVAHVALTGGSSAASVHRALVARALERPLPWRDVHLWLGDDRLVPLADPESNGGSAAAILLDGRLPIPDGHLHAIPSDATLRAGGDEDACARAYAAELAALVPPGPDGWPVLDLVILGVGSDGHCLSVFPESAALGSLDWLLGIPAPRHIGPHLPRVTMNPAVVPVAREILAVAAGEGKAAILGAIFREPRDPRRLPAQLALRGSATWLIDAGAARDLPAGVADRQDGTEGRR